MPCLILFIIKEDQIDVLNPVCVLFFFLSPFRIVVWYLYSVCIRSMRSFHHNFVVSDNKYMVHPFFFKVYGGHEAHDGLPIAQRM